jgi:hypothetical protein
MRQTELQKFMMQKLLGLKCKFLSVTCTADDKPRNLSWRTLRNMLDRNGLPKYMEAALELAANPNRSSAAARASSAGCVAKINNFE